jgi:hypothetical protein
MVWAWPHRAGRANLALISLIAFRPARPGFPGRPVFTVGAIAAVSGFWRRLDGARQFFSDDLQIDALAVLARRAVLAWFAGFTTFAAIPLGAAIARDTGLAVETVSSIAPRGRNSALDFDEPSFQIGEIIRHWRRQ